MVYATDLRTEYLENPLAVVRTPRFSWRIESRARAQIQRAYQLQVFDEKGALVWDSGKVYSRETVGIRYGGAPLASGEEYRWQVCVWDKTDAPSAFSKSAYFRVGLDEKDWSKAAWIGGETKNAPYLRKGFTLPDKKIRRAYLYATGLGLYELYLNGEKVGNNVLEQTVTQYHKRFFYSTYDVTALLKTRNALGAILGRGYYATLPNGRDWQVCNWAYAPWSDERKLRLRLNILYDDGTKESVATDESWKIAESPLSFDEPYYGEAYDARLEIDGWRGADFDDQNWAQATMKNPPKGLALPQPMEGICVAERIEPLSKTRVGENRYVFDMGKMTSGWCSVSVKGQRGAAVKIRYSEKLCSSGELDRSWLLDDSLFDGAVREGQTDYYTLKGIGVESWSPRFTYKGFRYVEVTLDAGVELIALQGESLHTDVASIGEFACSERRLNEIHELCRRSLLNNYHGYPSDTPVYEKLGYLADGFITQDVAAYNFSTAKFYEKWAADIRLQVKENGYVEQTAPMWNEEKENAPEWSLAMIFCPWQHYLFYGDKKILQDNYEMMEKVLFYQLSLGQDGEFSSMWGDHGGALRRISPTAHIYYAARVLSEISAIVRKEKSAEYAALADKIKTDFQRIFFDENAGFYCENAGGFRLNAQILPLAFGLVPDEKKAALWETVFARIEALESLDCGILSLKYLFTLLAEQGRGDLALKMILDERYHSYGYLLKQGATALWEFWKKASRSYDHHMYATVDEFFYGELAGLRRDGVGFSSLLFRPYPLQGLEWCKAETDTLHGKASSAWKNTENAFVWEICVPPNTTATVYVPLLWSDTVLENGAAVEEAQDVVFVEKKNGYCVCKVGSGEYRFTNNGGAGMR